MALPLRGRFAAIEVKSGETPHQAIGSLMHLAASKGLLFGAMEIYDTFTVNKIPFVRFRTDLDVGKLTIQRGVVIQAGDHYEVILANGTRGNYPLSAMHSAARVTERRTYQGTTGKFWDRQF